MNVGKIGLKNIYKPKAKNEESDKLSVVKVGKLKNVENMFDSQSKETEVEREVRVGKIDAENIYKPNEEENYNEKKSQLKVGKLSKDVFNYVTFHLLLLCSFLHY